MLYFGGDDYHPLQHTSYQDMPLREIAAALHIAVPTVGKRIKAACSKLGIILEGGRV